MLLVLGALFGSWGVGKVLSSDPVAYGVPFWPFADSADRIEQRLMSSVEQAALTGQPVDSSDVQVVERVVSDGNVFITLRLRVNGETRCREAIISHDFSSRRVDCG